MGRKFSGGGTAGGGRSGRGGGVTYTRIIPPFLRNLVQLDGTEGEEEEPGTVKHEAAQKASPELTGRKELVGEETVKSVDEGIEGELAELRRAGFHVDAEETSTGECSKVHIEVNKSSGVAVRSIDKPRSRHAQKSATSKAKPTAHFSVCNSNTLSFAEADGASSSSEGD
jgi:hypothetical protein